MYKLLILDLDGTTIPNQQGGMPSAVVIDAIRGTTGKLRIAIATGRPWPGCKHIFHTLGITTPSIISGGTEIIDPVTERRLWQQPLSADQVERVFCALAPFPHEMYVGDEPKATTASAYRTAKPENIIFVMTATPEDSKRIVASLQGIPDLAIHQVRSWKDGHFDIHISHREATKKHAVDELLKILGIEKECVAAVGDSNNDSPLFSAVGYKIAMGNATDELKAEADWIAPTQSDDGVAAAIARILAR